MPEGHSIRHFADIHERLFLGHTLEADSPQGRFAAGAEIISGRPLDKVSAHGKHLFLHFSDEEILHVHLGLYGWFSIYRGEPKEERDSIRLRMTNRSFTSELTAPTKCEIVNAEGHARIVSKLGPDPIHEDANPIDALRKIQKSNKSIAALLMDQSIIAGIGNVYRAEILFRAGQNPFDAGKTIGDRAFFKMWTDAVQLLREGSKDGMIRTVNREHMTPHELSTMGKYVSSQNSYVYKRTGHPCRVCGAIVRARDVSGRMLYWCPSCQM